MRVRETTMWRVRLELAVLLLAGGVAGCGGSAGDASGRPPAADSGMAAPAPPPGSESRSDSAGAAGPAGAVAVLRDYYAAVAAGDFAAAYRLWSDGGQASGQSLDEFMSGYADTRSVALEAGEPGRIEGAAGSRYVDVPVSVSAETHSGVRQCFRGSYVLRRSEVPGASADQRAWRIHSAALVEAASGECGAAVGSPAADSVAAVVREFGTRLSAVSTLASPEAVRTEIRARYGPLVTRPLLEAWLADPGTAPGRAVSSPWPDRIEIDSIEAAGADRFRVRGTIVYVSSTEAGTDAVADRRPVTIEAERTPTGWRLGSFSSPP